MSHAVVRGSPTQSQLYLDGVVDSIIQDGGSRASTREEVNLAEVLYYCLRAHSGAIHSINAATGESFTKERILKRAVSIARALTASCTRERVVLMLRNHEHMSVLFYGVLFAGVVPFMMEPGSTEYEIQQFLPLISPRLVFCERERRDDVIKAARGCDVRTDVMVADGPSLDKFVEGYSEDFESYKLHYTQFPHPTGLALLLSTAQWLSHTMVMTTCPVYQVPILMSPLKITAEYFVEMAEKYRPTWAILGPSLAAQVGHVVTPGQLSSFESLNIGGSPFTPATLASLREKLSPSANLGNGYGLTEAHGYVAVGAPGTPLASVGSVVNIYEYKLINSSSEEISTPSEKGELYIRGKCFFKGYVNNEASYHELVTPDGWLKTGDVFYTDENGQLFFVNRSKLGFKYLNYQIYPEEIEHVIASVPGVELSVVCGAEAGPAAAVVLLPGCDVSRESIHQAVSSTLSDYKRLRGGVAFVPALPRTHSGKVNRARCFQLIQELIGKGECL